MDKMTKSTAKQLIAVCIPLVLIIGALLLGIVYPRVITLSDASTLWAVIALFALILIGISIRRVGKPTLRLSPIIPVMAIFAVVVLYHCSNTPQYDETLYYYRALVSTDSFDFTLGSILDLAWHDHPMIPYALYITAGQALFTSYITVIVQNLILSLVTIYSVYRLILRYVGDTKRGRICSALGSAAFALSPVFITSCLCLSSDFPILAFLPIFICALAHDYKIISLASALCLLFSKLPGTALGIIIIGIILLTEFVRTLKSKGRISALIKSRLCIIIPLIAAALYFIFFLRIWGDSFFTSSGSSDVPNCFTFDLHYIALKLAQIFVLQFNWIPTAIIIIFGIVLLARKKGRCRLSEVHPATIALVTSFLAYLFYCLGYVTHAHTRYSSLSIFYLVVFATVIFCKLCNIYYIRYVILSVIALLMLSSFFFNSDFVSNRLFYSYDFSGSSIINTHAFSWENPQQDITDSVVYNSKFTQLNELYKKAHKQLEITSQDNIIHLNLSRWKVDFADSWKDGALRYDDDSHERSVALWREEGYPMPACYYLAQRDAVYDNFADFKNQYFIDSIDPDLLPDNAVIVLFPWQESEIGLFSFYSIDIRVTVEHNGLDLVLLRVSK